MTDQTRKQQITKVITVVFCLLVIPLILGLLVLIFPASAAPAASSSGTAKHYTELTFPALPEVKVPPYKRFQLPNGLSVYLMEDHEWPLVSGLALVRTGDRWEPADKVGLAGLTGELMRTGGTRSHSPEQLNQALEQQAAAVESSIGTTAGRVNFTALSENLKEVFDLFAEVIQEPVFAQEKLDLEKNQQRGAIARQNDSPESIAGRELGKLIYGATSPYARIVDYASLDRISRQDVVNFYQQAVRPDQMILGIVGDFDSQALRSLIEAKFGNWRPQAGQPQAQKLPPVKQAEKGGLFFINQPQLTQSYVQLGQLGGDLKNPDVFALYVMNGVLNGFGGRLFNQVRSREGLAYSVYALWQPEFDFPGTFVAGGQTRSDATVPFIQSVQDQLQQIRTTPVTESELAYAKDSILNSFVFNFQDPAQTLSRLLSYEYYDYPSDFIFRYQQGVKATTAKKLQQAAQTYLKPEEMVTLVVGNQTAIKPGLTTLQAKVTTVDITIK
jgi:zinc protease